MPYAKADMCPREDPAAEGSRVGLISARLCQRKNSPDVRYESGLEAKEAGKMVAMQRRKGRRRKWKTKKSSDKNGATKRGQKVNEEIKQQNVDYVATACIVPHPLVR